MSPVGTIAVSFRGTLGRFALDAAFTVPARGVTALFGPSGCGKTSVLRAIAGLHRFQDGICVIDGEVWQDGATFRPSHRRPIGYVFQEASLFPHLSVRRNLLFGARSGAAAAGPAFDDVVALLGLAPLLGRGPSNLSGGERQRVAIGRALLSRPRLLLMDEPLTALDRTSRDDILPFLERLHETLSLPVIYVTHDRGEVERLADTLVALRAGRVIAAGPLAALQSDPSLPFARDRDAAVTLDTALVHYDSAYGIATLVDRGLRVLAPSDAAEIGRPRRVRIAAADVSLTLAAPEASTILNVVPVTVLSATPVEDHALLAVLDAGGPCLLARVTRLSWDRLHLRPGMPAYAQVKSVALLPR